MRRRDFLKIVGGAVAALPFAADAQQSRAHRIGVLAQDLQPGLLETFRDELHKLGYVEGTNLVIELRNAAGQNDRLPALAEELLHLKVDVIVAVNTPAAQTAKKATQTVPIVVMRVADPVKSGLVASLSHPGGNVTGLSFMPDALGPKGVELLHEILPDVARMAALYQGDNAGAVVIVDEVVRKGEQLGLKFVRAPVHDPKDYASAFEIAAAANCKALFVMDDGAITSNRKKYSSSPQSTRYRWSRSIRILQSRAVSLRMDRTSTLFIDALRTSSTNLSKARERALFRLNSR